MSIEGRVSHMFVSPVPDSEVKPRGGFPMVELEEAMLVQGRGMQSRDGQLVDRYQQLRGAYSKTRPEVRQLSLVTQDALDRANSDREKHFTHSDTRRNIILEELTAEELNGLMGHLIYIGGVLLRGIELCEPCDRPSKLSGKSGFKESFTNIDGISTGGLRVEILSSGLVKVGASVLRAL